MKPLHYAKQIAYSSWDVLLFTHQMAVKFKDSPGVYVECGVAAGAQIIAMAYGAPNKTIYAFDSFEGIPLPSNRDDQMPGIAKLSAWEQKALPDPGKQVLETSGATSVTVESFVSHVCNAFGDVLISYDSNPPIYSSMNGSTKNIRVVKGWFEETMPQIDERIYEIALLRLDGDLFNSTWVCLQYLFPIVVKGGCVILDDFSLVGCRDAAREYFELIGYEPKYEYLDGTAYFFK